jgi:hypothetical protein
MCMRTQDPSIMTAPLLPMNTPLARLLSSKLHNVIAIGAFIHEDRPTCMRKATCMRRPTATAIIVKMSHPRKGVRHQQA